MIKSKKKFMFLYVRWQRGTTRIRPSRRAAERRAAIDRYRLPAGPAGLLLWAHAGTDRQPERQSDGRPADALTLVHVACG